MAIIPTEDLKPRKWSLVHYTVDVQRDDWATLLAPFTPPLPREGGVIMVSFFGDVFVEAGDGAVWWVNGTEARVDHIAESKAAFEARLADEHIAFLKTPVIDMMEAADRVPAPGRIYGLKTPRHEGGGYDMDNIGTATVAEAIGYMGSVFAARRQADSGGAADAPAQPAAELQSPASSQTGEKPKKKGWFS